MKWALPLIAAVTACSAAPKTQIDETTLVRQAGAISTTANAAVAKDVTEIEVEVVKAERLTIDSTENATAGNQ